MHVHASQHDNVKSILGGRAHAVYCILYSTEDCSKNQNCENVYKVACPSSNLVMKNEYRDNMDGVGGLPRR